MKLGNADGGKAVAHYELSKRNIYHTGGVSRMETELAKIAEVVKKHPNNKLQTLVHVINAETLKTAHKRMLGNKATGIDGTSKGEYEVNLKQNLEDLVERMKKQSYKPQAVRRTYIPKAGSKEKRPLGIPSYEDKLVQHVIAEILNVIYEPKFLDISYGFRPNRSCHDAIKELGRIIETKKVNYILDADIKGFFDNVDHDWLMKFLEHNIGDKNLLRLIARFLKAGIMEEGKYLNSDKGTPQGGLISPILANIYLHFALDLWFEKVAKQEMQGESYMIRYADDFVCCFQYESDAKKFYQSLRERLKKFNLEVAEEKTKLIEFGRFAEDNRKKKGKGKPETFNFLGFTHYCSKSRNGKFRVKRKTDRKKFQAKLKIMKQWLWENMHTPVETIIKTMNIKLLGHYRYYGVTDNSKSINMYRRRCIETFFKTLKRRTQKHGLTWDIFNKMLEYRPIASAKIYVSVYG